MHSCDDRSSSQITKGSEYYRQLVSTYADERHKHFTRAAREFKRNDRYAGQVAMFYAMEVFVELLFNSLG